MASSGTMEAELGSKANPIEKQVEAPPKSEEEADAKQIVPATKEAAVATDDQKVAGAIIGGIVEVGKFQAQQLINLVTALMQVDRKIAIGLKNFTRQTFQSSGVYYYSGSSDTLIPYQVPPNYACLWGARKSASGLRGCIGTYAYFIPGENKTVLVMYHVPYDYNLYSNWWNVTVVNGCVSPNANNHDALYYGSGGMPYPNFAGSWCRTRANGFEFLGNMTTNGQATLELEIRKF